jgi:hypothetical protein
MTSIQFRIRRCVLRMFLTSNFHKTFQKYFAWLGIHFLFKKTFQICKFRYQNAINNYMS